MSSVIYETHEIFPLTELHVHSPSIVEIAPGDLLVCWYEGSGERKADDVLIKGARKRPGERKWSQPFVMVDTPGFPDTNPVMFVDTRDILWLMWPVIIANRWETALLRYRQSDSYHDDGPPAWSWQDDVLLKPGPDFQDVVAEGAWRFLKETTHGEPGQEWLRNIVQKAGNKYFRRMGWMTRNKPLILDSGRLLLPLYSDGFSFSIMAITGDWGQTWSVSDPIVGIGNVQPSVVQKADGTLVTYMRDNGPAPKRLAVSVSHDGGKTWSIARDTDIPNPGSSAGVLGLSNGEWAMIYNDTESGRHSLAVSISGNEGSSWEWTRHLELDTSGEKATASHYPTMIEGADGSLHAVYSFHHNDREGPHKTIKYARFDPEWVKAGD